jgi:uncharacterized small protein (DUF1192 family)
LGQFDIGLYAQDLLKYNQTTNEFATHLGTKSVKASLQYTYEFLQNRGLLANARLMPLVQVGQNEDGSVNYVGSMLLDFPDYGWFQTNFDREYGLSMGLGFNLSKKMSLGYLLEKDLMNGEADLGWNHEVTLAYTLDREHNAKGLFAEGSEDEKVDRIVRNYEEQILALKEEVERNKAAINKRDAAAQVANREVIDDLYQVADREVMDAMANMNDVEASALAYENRLILDALILRQDSIDAARAEAFDRRLTSVVDALKDELKQSMQSPDQNSGTTLNTAVASDNIKEEILKRMGTHSEAIADNTAQQQASTQEAYTRTVKFEPVDKVLGEIITKPTVIQNANTDDMKNGVKLPIKTMKKSDLVGVKPGYYVIANVFKSRKYLDAFLGDLKQKGLDAGYFYNKENGLHYVYLADYNYKSDAKSAYVSDLNGQYSDEKWIMQVDNAATIVDNFYEDQ